ncbi:hypothetical protein PT279_08740 [Bifidobacterium sp. ESL0784]|uniref:hypothetical protein n=1 Tax=Bifidobacterium sp. ESL0784 TaxID=2983231 RepID=UPI0023F8C805|nr:hypothetical protein [Bifidobacterium sp. ESL0784]MDF7641667.1 hypothetical protein [Bifidobacterium sp. ESL0784]
MDDTKTRRIPFWQRAFIATVAVIAALALLFVGHMVWVSHDFEKGMEPPEHESFISTYRRHADIVTQTDSLFLDHRWDVQKALQGHGPDIKADTVAGQMSNTTGIITTKASGYKISFARPISYPDGQHNIRVSMNRNAETASNMSVNISVSAHGAAVDTNEKPDVEKRLGLTEQQAEDMATQMVHLVLDTAAANWPQ